MLMHKISFVHVNFQQGPRVFNAHYLPYTAGVLWAYALKHKDISQRYVLDQLLWRREDIDVAVASLEHSDVICFCTYVWSRNYNYTLAREVKARWPNKLIIFGGPEPALERRDFFEQLPFIDIMVCQEGEQALAEVLAAWPNSLEHIPGLLLNKAGVAYNTGPSVRIANLDQVPSPYLMGLFDRLVADNPTVEWSATLETNRGCPYQCTFCDWGSLTYNKVKKFDLTRVMDELEWMGRNHCGFITIADANFGMFVERDMLVAEKLIEIQSQYGWPKSYTLSWAKNQKDDVINIAKKLIDAGHTRTGLNLSLQTLDDAVLSNIKRKNLAMNRVEDVFKLCDLNNIPLYTELILGLPGETVDTWKKNFWKLYAAGNHTGITAYQAQLLENAEMNLVQRRLHKLTGQPVYDYYDGANNFDHLEESIEVVTSTATLNHEQMLAALEFTWYQMTFHISGFTTYISRILNKLYGIGYDEFYTRLWQDLVKDAWIKEQRDSTVMHFNNLLTKGRIEHDAIMGVNIFSVNLFQRTTISVHAEDRVEQVYAIIKDHVTSNYTQDPNLTEQLVEFQKMHVARHGLLTQYPISKQFDYDFIGYLLEDKELSTPTQYQFNFAEDKSMSLTTFCEQIFFARRKNFGKTIITKHAKKT
jgi:tRNA A37 methylthiotransferase MiaB